MAGTLVNTPSTPKHPIQIQLPLHRPKSLPCQPVLEVKPQPRKTVKPQPRKTNSTSATTTSDVLYFMDTLNLPISLDIYVSLIKECTGVGDCSKAIELYSHMRKNAFSLNLTLANRLMLMFIRCGCLDCAQHLFDQMPVRNFNSWAVMIAGCVDNGNHREAIDLFIEMLFEEQFSFMGQYTLDFALSGIFVSVLKACVKTSDLELGMQIHSWLLKMGVSRNAVFTSFLINFYGKCKCSSGADNCFDQVCSRNTAVWTARIAHFCREDNFELAVNVFREMGRQEVRKNSYTFSSVLKACSQMGDGGHCCKQVHAHVLKAGVELDNFVQCALVDLYGKCGLVNDAKWAFEVGRNRRTNACWNAMLTAFVQNGFCIQAIKLIYKMKASGLEPPESLSNEVKFICGSGIIEPH